MTQRLALPEDVPAIVALGRKFHAMSPHKDMAEYDEMGVARVVSFMIESPQSVVLFNGTGVIGATYAPVYFAPSKWMCEENFWFSDDRGGLELLDGLTIHAKGWGATHLCLSTLENAKTKVIDRLLTRKGFKAIERRYILELTS
jgi:hypothetical protein